MINLIPKEEKRQMMNGFYHKLVVLCFAVIGISLCIMFASMLPSYFLSYVKVNFANKKLANQKLERVPQPLDETLSIIADLEKKLGLIEHAEINTFTLSQHVIRGVIFRKTSEIKIISISYQDDALEGKKINIGGIAPSREALLSFRQALEDSTFFRNVDLPISNFIKGSNIQFYLTLTPL